MEAVVKYFSLFMCVLYLLIGAAMITGSSLFNNVPRRYALVMGAIMIVYGLFRGYRVYSKYFTNQNHEG
ncbi:hypothetical protein WSM22_27990 [Cytophagales bacterium WSM2-2]|nr:hypothetical protein WSM22_27990 [Cytophagales bacterium WSM2-2]